MRCGGKPSPESRSVGVILVRSRRRCEIHNSPAEERKGKGYRQHSSNLRFSIHRVTFMSSRTHSEPSKWDSRLIAGEGAVGQVALLPVVAPVGASLSTQSSGCSPRPAEQAAGHSDQGSLARVRDQRSSRT
jgi:hypothetical protein